MEIEARYYVSLDDFLKEKIEYKYVLLVGYETKIDLEKLSRVKKNIYGAIFPQIIYNNSTYKNGLIAIKIDKNMKALFIKDMSKSLLKNKDFKEVKSALTIVAGISNSKECFLQELFEKLDIHTKIIGGGAGFYKDIDRNMFFDNKKFYKNSAILLTLKNDITLSVKHGWEYLKGPFIVTSTENNILKKVDYKDAFDVYRDVIKDDCGITIDENNFEEVSKNYPIGIVKYRKEQILRDPVALSGKSLVLVAKVSNNSIINILKGRNKTLLKASREAAAEVLQYNYKFVMMFDCISRKDFLQDKFDEELDSIYKQSTAKNFIGAITIGEIANEGNNHINFLNKTCVIGGICS